MKDKAFTVCRTGIGLIHQPGIFYRQLKSFYELQELMRIV